MAVRVVACVVACGALALPGATVRAEDAPVSSQLTVADITLGPRVSGPARSPESLAGRVVVLEFWGVSCPPCLKNMPALESLHRQLGRQGLVVIGAHAQQAEPEEIAEVVEQLGVTFTIVERAVVDGGMDFPGIPHCMVFDHTGVCVYRGHPRRAHEAIVEAVRSSPASVLDGRPLVMLAPLGRHLHDESAFGAVLVKARSLAASKDAATAAEARFVVERLEDYGDRLVSAAKASADEDPLRAVHYAGRCSVAFRGTDIGQDAADMLRGWKQDRGFQERLLAARRAEAVAAERGVPVVR